MCEVIPNSHISLPRVQRMLRRQERELSSGTKRFSTPRGPVSRGTSMIRARFYPWVCVSIHEDSALQTDRRIYTTRNTSPRRVSRTFINSLFISPQIFVSFRRSTKGLSYLISFLHSVPHDKSVTARRSERMVCCSLPNLKLARFWPNASRLSLSCRRSRFMNAFDSHSLIFVD